MTTRLWFLPGALAAIACAFTGPAFSADPAAVTASLPPALGIPAPGPTNGAPYAPQPILPGGVVVPL